MSKDTSEFEEIRHRIIMPPEHIYAPHMYQRKAIENSLYAKFGFADYELNLIDDPLDPRYDVRKLYRPVKHAKKLPSIPKLDPTSPEYVFWKFWFNRMKLGYYAPDGRYISGYQTFGYNFSETKIRDPKDVTSFVWMDPLFRDNDHVVANIIWNNRVVQLPGNRFINARNHVEAKARGVGWTVMNKIIGMYNFTVGMHLDSTARAYPDEDSLKPERLEFQEAWSRLHPIFRSYVTKGSKKAEEMEVLYNNQDGDFSVGFRVNKIAKIISECSFDVIQSEKSTGVYKGARKLNIEVIEAGKWKKGLIKSLFEKNEKCIGSSGVQWGSFTVGGTSDAILHNDSDYKDMIVNHKKYGATLHLSNAGVCQIGHIDYRTGKSDVVSAIKGALDKRKEKSYDPARLQAEISENPIFLEEMLNPQVSYAYNKVTLTEIEKKINDNALSRLWVRGKIVEEKDAFTGANTGKVEFQEDESGRWLMNMEGPPLPFDHEYFDIAAIDDRNTNWKDGSIRRETDSKNAMIIYRRRVKGGLIPGMKADIPVMIYFSDEQDMFLEYAEFIKGIKLYSVKQVANEKNNVAFWGELKKAELEHVLMMFDGDVGLKVTEQIKNHMTTLGQRYFAEGRHQNMTSQLILDSFKIWGSGDNTDIGSAMHIIFYMDDVLEKAMREPLIGFNPLMADRAQRISMVIKGGSHQEKNSGRVMLGRAV